MTPAAGEGFAWTALPDFRRTRRLRRNEAVRALARETAITAADFIQPPRFATGM